MNTFRHTLCIAMATCLCGCVVKYQVPADTPKATITFAAEDRFTFGKLRVQAFEDDKCTKSKHGTRIAYYFMRMYDEHSGVDRDVVAGKEFVYSWVFGLGTKTVTNTMDCTVTSAFTPLPGEKYKATFGFTGNACVANLYHVTSKEGILEPVPARQITPACAEHFSD